MHIRYLITAVILLVSTPVLAAGGGDLQSVKMDLKNQASLQRGAKVFMNYCFGCHSTQYARYERVADDLEIPHELFMENMVFSDAKIGQLMTSAMPAKPAKNWFGETPPDLTLGARLRGSDWLYTYLKSFYADEKRP